MKTLAVSVLLSCGFLWFGNITNDDDKFVFPESPIALKAAPSQKVTNGHVFESGKISLPDDAEITLPANAVVKEYQGTSVRFFLTKSLHCLGHPPIEMGIESARNYFGMSYQNEDLQYTFSTFGEWSNKGGSAKIKVLVLVPQGMVVKKAEGLEGSNSQASSEFDINHPGLEKCYWYAGIAQKPNWTRIQTDLNYNEFLQPE